MKVAINTFMPDWRNQIVHESSPSGSSSYYMRKSCPGYSTSQFFADVPRGVMKGKHRSEDLTQLTFENESIDLLLTCDVFEHVFHAEIAFAEVARVLKPGGKHIFSIPWNSKLIKTEKRAELNPDGSITYLKEPEYHKNPVDEKGALVTYDWGRDIGDIIYRSSGLTTTIFRIRDRSLGIDGSYIEIFVSSK